MNQGLHKLMPVNKLCVNSPKADTTEKVTKCIFVVAIAMLSKL